MRRINCSIVSCPAAALRFSVKVNHFFLWPVLGLKFPFAAAVSLWVVKSLFVKGCGSSGFDSIRSSMIRGDRQCPDKIWMFLSLRSSRDNKFSKGKSASEKYVKQHGPVNLCVTKITATFHKRSDSVNYIYECMAGSLFLIKLWHVRMNPTLVYNNLIKRHRGYERTLYLSRKARTGIFRRRLKIRTYRGYFLHRCSRRR